MFNNSTVKLFQLEIDPSEDLASMKQFMGLFQGERISDSGFLLRGESAQSVSVCGT